MLQVDYSSPSSPTANHVDNKPTFVQMSPLCLAPCLIGSKLLIFFDDLSIACPLLMQLQKPRAHLVSLTTTITHYHQLILCYSLIPLPHSIPLKFAKWVKWTSANPDTHWPTFSFAKVSTPGGLSLPSHYFPLTNSNPFEFDPIVIVTFFWKRVSVQNSKKCRLFLFKVAILNVL